ncbi:MAG: hypothetical protein ACRELD_06100 [Longimicrobiales bacterium]
MNLLSAIIIAQLGASAQQVQPELAFPEPGLDDSAAYEGYRTRFLRDAAGNVVQIYINQRAGRVVSLWADATNSSAGFTARRADGSPAPLDWGSAELAVWADGGRRYVEYRLSAPPAPLEIGAFLLGSMRLERDFQYQEGHLAPFGTGAVARPELLALIANLERLSGAERRRQLALLRAGSTAELRNRLRPAIRLIEDQPRPRLRIEQPTFDGRNRWSLEIGVAGGRARFDPATRSLAITPSGAAPLQLVVRIGTDAPTLSPLDSGQIFNADFLRFFDDVRDQQAAAAAPAETARFRRLERQVRSVALMSSEEKLMAGLPNYATYFGRDMIMSALMMEPIWSAAMIEHVIASALRKLSPAGEVSHEEALGGQAIRENAVVYNALIGDHFAAAAAGEPARAEALLDSARAVLSALQAVRENYHMVDDDFQLPVLAARYLGDPASARARKRAFLLAVDEPGGGSRLDRLLSNLAFVARQAEPYARDPRTDHLIGFPRRADGRWASASWRDSGAGYANGRFALDVNAIWVPEALAGLETILASLSDLGIDTGLAARSIEPGWAALAGFARDPARLAAAVHTWRGARDHFAVALEPDEARLRVAAWLASLAEPERGYWSGVVEGLRLDSEGVRFAALSLDSVGRPIPVVSTDPAMRLFLVDLTAQVLDGRLTTSDVLAEVQPFLLGYPYGLFVPALGPLVANDVYAAPEVWSAFREDLYHSPRVVWGREVNLLLLGLARQIAAAHDSNGELKDPRLESYVHRLGQALAQTVTAVEASGLKHNELWTYRIDGDRLIPVRYATSTDIQLWNLTDLAVQFALSRLPPIITSRLGGSSPAPRRPR